MCHLLLGLMVPMVVNADGGTGDKLPLPAPGLLVAELFLLTGEGVEGVSLAP